MKFHALQKKRLPWKKNGEKYYDQTKKNVIWIVLMSFNTIFYDIQKETCQQCDDKQKAA